MKFTPLKLPEVMLIEPDLYLDDRGYFYETYNEKIFRENVTNFFTYFVQDNNSYSNAGTIRGLHYQDKPYEQGKIIRVISGKVFDVAVDIRKNSKTYGQYVCEILSNSNKKQLWIPPGYAHGFMALDDSTEIVYKVTNFYSKAHERTINYKDPLINIRWPEFNQDYILSQKDLNAPFLERI
ncbi:MAG: dTDP-4-dehydrorhamnose 3,5-epimerase [Pelagibacteraceae bacterium]|nr:dTDP-4-dehydrorhamnose 3,5-epimerase [Pelagibacteraceae bacterium]